MDVANDFEKFLTLLQHSGPMIHLVHEEMTELLRKCLARFVRTELVQSKSAHSLLQIELKVENYTSTSRIDVGPLARPIIQELKKGSYGSCKMLLLEMSRMLESMATYMMKKFPLQNILLRSLRCLRPDERENTGSLHLFEACVKQMLHFRNDKFLLENVVREWKEYQNDCAAQPLQSLNQRIDHYWRQVFSFTDNFGKKKYEDLPLVVKLFLSLSHGQADVERGFSVNKMILNQRSSLHEETVIALRSVHSFIGNQNIEDLVISPTMIKYHREAHQEYKKQQTARTQGKRDENASKRKLTELADLHKLQNEWELKQKHAENLVAEASSRLNQALEKMDSKEIRAAQALLCSGSELLKESRSNLEHVHSDLSKLNAKGHHVSGKVQRTC